MLHAITFDSALNVNSVFMSLYEMAFSISGFKTEITVDPLITAAFIAASLKQLS